MSEKSKENIDIKTITHLEVWCSDAPFRVIECIKNKIMTCAGVDLNIYTEGQYTHGWKTYKGIFLTFASLSIGKLLLSWKIKKAKSFFRAYSKFR